MSESCPVALFGVPMEKENKFKREFMKCKKTESRSEKKSQANKEASEMKAERERIMNKMRVCVTVREHATY